MKYLKKKKSKVLPAICMAAALLAVIAAVVFLLTEGDLLNDSKPTAGGVTPQSDPADTEIREEDTTPATQPSELMAHGIAIDTPCGDIWFPGEYEDILHINVREDDGYVLEFYAKVEGRDNQPLFDLTFGGSGSGSIGAMTAADGTLIPVYLQMHDFDPGDDWSEDERNIVLSMQEAVNELMLSLDLKPAASDPGAVEIDTPYGTLRYPDVWREYLQVEIMENDPYTVEFYGKLEGKDRQLLFSLCYGGEEQDAFCMVQDAAGNQVPVHLTVAELSFGDSWTAEEMNVLYAMQESVNELLDSLMMDS